MNYLDWGLCLIVGAGVSVMSTFIRQWRGEGVMKIPKN